MTNSKTLTGKDKNMASTEIYRDGDYFISRDGRKLTIGRGPQSNTFTLTGSEEFRDPLPVVANQLGSTAARNLHWLSGQQYNCLIRVAAENQVQQVIDEIRSERDSEKAQARDALLATVPGLDELEAAYAARERHDDEFSRMMSDGNNDGARPPKTIVPDLGSLQRQYPAAAAYLKALSIADNSSWSSGRGSVYRKAAERIAAGEDWEVVMAEADSEWGDAASQAASRM